MTTARIAVVGAGMAAARLAQQLRLHTEALDITLYGQEPHAPYNRALLAGVLTGRYAPDTLTLPAGGATVRTGTEVVALDPAARTLRTATGETAAYDTLVLATGAAPVLPPVPGLFAPGGRELRPGAHVLRTLADCAGIVRDAQAAGRATVIGGGVLGIAAAQALATLGCAVRLVHREPHLLERHLDAQAAAIVRRTLEAAGVDVRTGADTTGVPDDGPLLLACGVRPRTRLARAAGLAVRTGIVVDDTLAASAPGVYAIGDCAEHRGTVHGRAEPAWEQADILAARLSGARPRYHGSPDRLRLTAGALEIAAFGASASPGPDTDTLRLSDATRGIHKSLILRDARLVGAALIGDLAAVGEIAEAVGHGQPLLPDPVHLLTGHPPPAFSAEGAPA
ncbi:FAD-dependent oxidoreductase [Streptomyces sp. ET3-23]|uniref:NAD(P)/FAD-dependent oxidoreductase n=1 Tax=Streptomyces sp. ET3-23 TaxID=2885643 RepID=UPI001D0F94C1|nr:FAD-dependent oxidoreductase [Streptomyces sp. ET3-23]MCC2275863.1 FAD-dependent oxidoreductase [Streptomyces sp. ET3-23]